MAAPSPDAIVASPAPLNPTSFPFRVEPFPGDVLATVAAALPISAPDSPARPSDLRE
jgi:hypothetical protein